MALTKFTEKLISDSFKASISGSDTTESSSFASRVTLVEGGTTSKTLVSSSAQIADDISGSLSSTAIASLGASIVSASVLSSPAQGTIRLATNGVNTDVDSGLQAGDSPTFAAGTITGDLSVGGTLTAQEVHTEFESASILFTSGSTQFGNSSDDVHEFKGNVISGSSTSTASLAMISLADKIEHIGDTNNTIEFGTDEIKLRTGGGSRLIARDSNVELYNDLVVAGAATFNEDSGDKDFRIESNDNTHMFFVDGGNNRIGIGVGASPAFATLDIDAPGATNADNLDQSVDRATLRVRYRTDETDDGMFFGGLGSSAGYIQGVIDASNDNTSQAGKTIAINPYGGNVGIGTNNVSELLHLYSTTSNSPNILIQNENDSAGEAGNAGGIEFYLKDDNGSNPDFQDLGIIRWTGHDKDNPYNKFTAAAITGSADDPGNSSGRIDFGVAYSDSMMNAMTIRASAASTTKVGIGESNPSQMLDLTFAGEDGMAINSTDSNATLYLQSNGTSKWIIANAPSQHELFISSAATAPAVTIRQDGKVGIGTNNPANLLHVRGDLGGIELHSDDERIGRIVAAGSSAEGRDAGYFSLSYGGTDTIIADAYGYLHIDDGGRDRKHFELKSSGDVAHGMTDYDDTNTFFKIQKASNATGGANIACYSEDTIGAEIPVRVTNEMSAASPAASDQAPFQIIVQKKNNTSVQALDASKMLVAFRNNTNTRFIFDSDGRGYAANSFNNTFSDSRLKKNVVEIPYGLETVNKLKPKKYVRYSGDMKDGEVVLEENGWDELGFIAQDVMELIPEVISNPTCDVTKGFYAMDNSQITSILVKAVQELSQKNEALEKRIEELEK